eukprot:TRINITY_DN11276_c0_g1_i1.p1 TRINITY_DN11276_c0_g1~~TRINITY_DN11276_c0_g1_i1.p1  ORF type:complete len:461 (-),score=113.33 TRINITY_DN11276_c0_g1_i1:105-1487(-)
MKSHYKGKAMRAAQKPLERLVAIALMLGAASALEFRSHEAPVELPPLGDLTGPALMEQMAQRMDILRLDTEREVYEKKLKDQTDQNGELARKAAQLEADVAQIKTYNSELLNNAKALQDGNEERRQELKLLSEQLENSVSLIRGTVETADSSHYEELEVLKPSYQEPTDAMIENGAPHMRQGQEPQGQAAKDAETKKHLLLLSMARLNSDDALRSGLEDVVNDLSEKHNFIKERKTTLLQRLAQHRQETALIQIESDENDDPLHSIAGDIINEVSDSEVQNVDASTDSKNRSSAPEAEDPRTPRKTKEDLSLKVAKVKRKMGQALAQETSAVTHSLAFVTDSRRSRKEKEEMLKQTFLEREKAGEQKHEELLQQIQASNKTLSSQKHYADLLIAANKRLKQIRSRLVSQLKEVGMFMKQMGIVADRKTKVAIQQLENVKKAATAPTAYQLLTLNALNANQ